MHDHTTTESAAPTAAPCAPPLTLTCPRCSETFASVAALWQHRMGTGATRHDGRTGPPCLPVYGIGVPHSPAPRVLDTGPAHSYAYLCPPVPLSGMTESAGPVLIVARVAVLIDHRAVAA